MNLPHGYTNQTRLDRDLVTKEFVGPNARDRFTCELAALTRLVGRLPVPHVRHVDRERCRLQLDYIAGRHGQDLIDRGHAPQVLYACGRLLRSLHELPSQELSENLPNDDAVIVHGDFGPQNVIIALYEWVVVGLLDWEWAHTGRPVEDLAWAEWIVRTHHPQAVNVLPELFRGFGDTPTWQERHAAMLAQCRRFLELARTGGEERVMRMWQERLTTTVR